MNDVNPGCWAEHAAYVKRRTYYILANWEKVAETYWVKVTRSGVMYYSDIPPTPEQLQTLQKFNKAGLIAAGDIGIRNYSVEDRNRLSFRRT